MKRPPKSHRIPTDTPVGTEVAVWKDDGSVFFTETRSLPRQLGLEHWTVRVNGLPGAWSLDRVYPAKEALR